MKKLTQDIKRMLSAFAYQDAGEFMSRSDKLKFLGVSKQSPRKHHPRAVKKTAMSQAFTPRVVILFDGQVSEGILDYVLKASSHMKTAEFDILAYGDDPDLSMRADALRNRLQAAGRKASVSLMMGETAELFNKFTRHNPALRYIVATEHDLFAKKIIANSTLHHTVRQLPLILIQDANHKKQTMISAA